MKLAQAQIITLTEHIDERGGLCEIYKHSFFPFEVKQLNIIRDVSRGTVRAWHKHHETWEAFLCVQGKVEFVLYDERPDSPNCKMAMKYMLDALNKHILIVPPEIYHGHIALTDNAQTIAFCDRHYCRDKPDLVKVEKNAIPYEWENIQTEKPK